MKVILALLISDSHWGKELSSWPRLKCCHFPTSPAPVFHKIHTQMQAPELCVNPRTLSYHILLFPLTWSLSEYLLWLTIAALIGARRFRMLRLIYCFCQPLNIKGKLIWQSAVTARQTSSLLTMDLFRSNITMLKVCIYIYICLWFLIRSLPLYSNLCLFGIDCFILPEDMRSTGGGDCPT